MGTVRGPGIHFVRLRNPIRKRFQAWELHHRWASSNRAGVYGRGALVASEPQRQQQQQQPQRAGALHGPGGCTGGGAAWGAQQVLTRPLSMHTVRAGTWLKSILIAPIHPGKLKQAQGKPAI